MSISVKTSLQREWRLFCVAVQFLTRWPVPSFADFNVDWLSQSLRYFPLVGVCVALLQWLLWMGLSSILPHPVAVVWVMGFGLLLTGGFHEDGWADVCDGMGGAYQRERVLEIMKDSRVGAFGAMGLVWILLSKWTVLGYLGEPLLMLFALVGGHALSRLSATALIVRLEHVGDAAHSKTKPLGNQMRVDQWLVSAGLLLVVMTVLSGLAWFFGSEPLMGWQRLMFALLIAAMVAGCVATACARYFVRRIGGYTGDCLGATQQVVELSVYTAILAVAHAPWAWTA